MAPSARARWTAAAAAGLLAAAAASAGPFMKSPEPELTDEVKSLAGLHRVGLCVNALPEEVHDAGLTEAEVQTLTRRRLGDAGFEVADDQTLPTLAFTVLSLVDPAVPDSVGFLVFLDVRDKVHMYRLERDMVLPIAVLTARGIKNRRHLAEGVKDRVKFLIKQLAEMERQATEHIRASPR